MSRSSMLSTFPTGFGGSSSEGLLLVGDVRPETVVGKRWKDAGR